MSVDKELHIVLQNAKREIHDADQLSTLESIRVKLFGKKGKLSELFSILGTLPVEQRPEYGNRLNQTKTVLVSELEKKRVLLLQLSQEAKIHAEKIDLSVTRRVGWGSRHPITQICDRVIAYFTALGFKITEGPEIEDEYHNFEALNIPSDHPARAMADTFYFPNHLLLRTHTSPVQIREMESHGVPTRLITFGCVYRRDSDQTHTPMFHQLEGLVVDKQCNFSHLKGLMERFLAYFFHNDDVKLRFRPAYFPFTEPSAEVDLYQEREKQWLEVLGCGMVHPNVLSMAHLDPEQYVGFAFGIGLDRLAMLYYGVPDLRLFFENDLRFLKQFYT